MVWDFIEGSGLLKVIMFILVIPGIIILCFCLWFDIFVPLNVTFIYIPVKNDILLEFGKGFDLLMPIVVLVVSVLFFVTLKLKMQTVWMLMTVLSLFGYYPLVNSLMGVQAFPNVVYEAVGLTPTNDRVEITTGGEIRTYTLNSKAMAGK
jgi:hypothetical protein